MKSFLRAWFGVLPVIALATGCHPAPLPSQVETRLLPNGIQLVSIHFPNSTNVSIFTFLPLGLATDGPDQAQWSHLVEHLVIRSTIPADSKEANAETLPDHMRLDFYGNTGNWKYGLSHHRRWLEGVPFSETNLVAEKPRVTRECDVTARVFATHKFAVAAWSQALRHGSKHVALKGDVMRAQLADVQRLRNTRLAVSNQVTVCIVGGVDAKTVFETAARDLGSLSLPGVPPKPSRITIQKSNLDLTWDLDARHLLITWPIPDFRQPDYAALMVAALKLNVALASETLAKPGAIFAGADLTTPDGTFFFISASLPPGADVDAIRQLILKRVEGLTVSDEGSAPTTSYAQQLSAVLGELQDPAALKAQMPKISLALLEGNVGLQRGMYEYRYGNYRAVLVKELAAVSTAKVNDAARKYLSADKATICTIQPAARPVSARER